MEGGRGRTIEERKEKGGGGEGKGSEEAGTGAGRKDGWTDGVGEKEWGRGA